MFDRDKWQEISEALSKNKLRTFLTAFGVFWGIFMLVIMLGSGKGLENGVKSDFGGFANNALYVWTQRTTKAYKGFKPGRAFNLTNADITALQNMPELDAVAPRCQLGNYGGTNNVLRGLRKGNYQVMGDYPELMKIQPKKMTLGRFVNQLDLKEKRKVAVIGARVRDELFPYGEDPIGKYISINGIYFKVIGVFDVFFSGNNSQEELKGIFIPFSTFQNAFNWGNIVGWFSVTAKPQYSIVDVEPKVIQLLKSRHSIAPDDPRAFGFWNEAKGFSEMNSLFMGINVLIWVVGIGTLLAGIIGVSNIMLVVVKERTKEIGIRKALGATPFNIISQIMTEAVILTSIAGYLGLVASVLILEAINKAMKGSGGMFQNPEVNFNVAITAIIVLTFAGMIAGLIPARKAATISPVEALRYE